MAQHHLGGRSVLAAALLAGAVALTGCGAVTFGRTSATSPAPSAAGSATSSQEPSPSATQEPAPTSTTSTATPSPSSTTQTVKPKPKPSAPRTTRPTPSTTTTTPTPTPSPSTPKPPAQPQPGDTLQVGDSGPYVLSVQQRLAALGYWNGAADGTYGGLTVQAVMALQKAAGLGRDGVFGPATARALQAGTRPQSRIGGDGIEVDKARQLLLIVRGGHVQLVLNTSTGSGQHYDYEGVDRVANTPSGTFSTFRSVDHLDKGPLGDLWRPRYFNGGIAVHGAASVPGYPASHGCARVSNPAMNMIWANGLMPIGGRVTVY